MENLTFKIESTKDYFEAEALVKRAFWNHYAPGCSEHYLLHKMREDPNYIPELSLIAFMKDQIVGCIYYTTSYILDVETGNKVETLTFGPLAVDPIYQKQGIGKQLILQTIEKAKQLNYPAIIIYGHPEYYSKFGFKNCDQYHITTADGENFDAFMICILDDEQMKQVQGKHYIASVFNQLDEADVESYDQKFPYLEKR